MLRCMLHCWDNSPKAYSKCTGPGLWKFFLAYSCLSVCPGSECSLCCPLILGRPFLSLKSFMITELTITKLLITELSVKLAKLATEVWVWIWIRSRGCCERNESLKLVPLQQEHLNWEVLQEAWTGEKEGIWAKNPWRWTCLFYASCLLSQWWAR